MAKISHGHALNGRKTPTYASWVGMRQRCTDPNSSGYHNYGARGVTTCSRWESFNAFLEDMGEKPPGMSLDRINNDGDYEPANVRWATAKQQARNTRVNRMLTFNGETRCMVDWAESLGIRKTTLHERLAAGWTVEKALTAAVQIQRRKATSATTG
jgi:hypothetical protein